MIATRSDGDLLTALRLAHPEWRPLLALVEEALREIERPEWRDSVSAPAPRDPESEPLLSGAILTVGRRPIDRWVRRVLETAAGIGPGAHFVDPAATRGVDPLALLQAAVAQDLARLDDIASAAGDSHGMLRGVLRGVAPLIAMPLLQACHRAWADPAPAAWSHGYCPTCGAWPALAEIRGLDGARHLRCRGCGGDWATAWLRCPFCGEHDHTRLGSLVASEGLEREKIEVCDACHGYLKTITTFGPIPAEQVVLHDLATVGLDVAAVERGYRTPSPRSPLAVRIVARRSGLYRLAVTASSVVRTAFAKNP
jgi:FdhE protein